MSRKVALCLRGSNGVQAHRLTAWRGAAAFGRPMKEWVEIPAEHASRWVELASEALRYVDEAQKRK
jgi:hypothetical protein